MDVRLEILEMVVFQGNKADMVDDEELLELAEMKLEISIVFL
jgi:translation elongation factor EF-Tu-like GTPase